MTKEEALDLPPKIYITREYEMGPETLKRHREIKEMLMTALDDGTIVDVPNAAVALLRMQQVVCGFLPNPEDNGKLVSINNERIEQLLEIIRQRRGKTVIWARFREDIVRIATALEKEEGKGCAVTYTGSTSTKDRIAAMEGFLNGKSSVRFFVAIDSAGGTGTNLQGLCQTVIYYSCSFNALHRWQSEDRTHRIGMKGAVTYFDLVAAKSVDRLIIRNLKKKKSISELTLDDIRQAIREL